MIVKASQFYKESAILHGSHGSRFHKFTVRHPDRVLHVLHAQVTQPTVHMYIHVFMFHLGLWYTSQFFIISIYMYVHSVGVSFVV